MTEEDRGTRTGECTLKPVTDISLADRRHLVRHLGLYVCIEAAIFVSGATWGDDAISYGQALLIVFIGMSAVLGGIFGLVWRRRRQVRHDARMFVRNELFFYSDGRGKPRAIPLHSITEVRRYDRYIEHGYAAPPHVPAFLLLLERNRPVLIEGKWWGVGALDDFFESIGVPVVAYDEVTSPRLLRAAIPQLRLPFWVAHPGICGLVGAVVLFATVAVMVNLVL